MSRPIRIPVEVAFTGAMILLLLILSVAFGLPIRLPSGGSAELVGGQLFLPLIGIGVWVICALFANRKASPWRPLLGLACYGAVMIVHFNLKLWVPFVRTASYDPLFWQMDQFARPIVDACKTIRIALRPFLFFWKGIYLWSFVAMFYISFGYHAIRTPESFRKLFLAALFMQGMGAIGYLLLPAIGPFIYEPGTSATMAQTQHDMLMVRHMSMAAGPQWLSDNASANMFAGLGAMPSLHAGCSFLFLWFAWRHGRALLPTYIPIFAYIVVTAIASRWHYLIDLPVGIGLARLAIHLAYVADRPWGKGEVAMPDIAPPSVEPVAI